MLGLFRKEKMWGRHPLKGRYDVVIIGAGVHGLATAYYLAKRGVRDIAVLDRSYMGGGGSARSTAILRANYITPEGIAFFRESLKMYEGLSRELGYNLLFTQMGRLDLGHSDATVIGLRQRAEFNRLLGVNSRMVGPSEINALIPEMDLREGKDLPVMAALHHPPGGVIRHDAVVWAYARGASRRGVEIHPFTNVAAIHRQNGRVIGVETSRGQVKADVVVNATAGWCSTVAAMAEVRLPITTHPLQAFVTEPLKPFLHRTISSANLHFYAYQTDRGRGGHRRGRGPLPQLQPALNPGPARGVGSPHAHAVPVPQGGQRPSPMDRPLRHDTRLRAHPRRGARCFGVRADGGLGNVGVQGRAHCRRLHRGDDRHRQNAGADPALLNETLPGQPLGQRASVGALRGGSLAAGRPFRGTGGPARSWRRPTKLDRIKNLHSMDTIDTET